MFDYRTQEEKIRARAINASLSLGVVNIETILQKTEEEQKRMLGKKKHNFVNLKISSPVAGKALSLKNSGDKVFAMKALGEGLAITNDSDSVTIVSPVDGVLQSVSPSKHAYTFMSNEGVGVLVHAGIDTVKLDGQGFNVLIQEGAKVKTGDKISIVNLKEIRDLGYKVPIVVTVVNTNIMEKVVPLEEGKDIKQGDQIIDLIK